jgi:hypothetical protein
LGARASTFDLVIQDEVARSGGWIARGQRLLDDGGHDCVERGICSCPLRTTDRLFWVALAKVWAGWRMRLRWARAQ